MKVFHIIHMFKSFKHHGCINIYLLNHFINRGFEILFFILTMIILILPILCHFNFSFQIFQFTSRVYNQIFPLIDNFLYFCETQFNSDSFSPGPASFSQVILVGQNSFIFFIILQRVRFLRLTLIHLLNNTIDNLFNIFRPIVILLYYRIKPF